jgi:hypothetical protein
MLPVALNIGTEPGNEYKLGSATFSEVAETSLNKQKVGSATFSNKVTENYLYQVAHINLGECIPVKHSNPEQALIYSNLSKALAL